MIVFVRHGETAHNRAGRLQGRADADLTDRGREQAAATAAVLAATAPVVVVASPLRRAVETAEIVAAACGAAVTVDERLVELDYGEWDLKGLGEVSPDEWARWRTDPTFAPPGGESLLDVRARVASFCEEHAVATPGAPVVAVSHVSPIKAAVVWALDASDLLSWRMHLDLASITRVGTRDDGRPYLASFNERAHLLAPDARR